MSTRLVEIGRIVCDWELYPRTQVSATRVQQLVDAIEAGVELPPIVCTQDLRILDGWHRHRAWRRLGWDRVPVRIVRVGSEEEAYIVAVRCNVDHGLPLQPYDRRRVVQRLRELGVEVERIAEIVRIPAARIEDLQRMTALDVSGRPVVLKRGLQHLAGRRLSERELRVNDRYQGFSGVFYARQLLDLLSTRPPLDDEFARELRRLRRVLNELPLDDVAEVGASV